MNDRTRRRGTALPFGAGILGSFLIFAVLVLVLHHYTKLQPLNKDRVALRAKAFADMCGAEAAGLYSPAWIDRVKGFLRLPIDDAMKIVVREWSKNPTTARSNLIARVEKATAPPSKTADVPSPFE